MEKREEENKQKKNRGLAGFLCLFIFLIAAVVFSFLIIDYFQDGWVARYRVWLIVAVCILAVALTIAGVIFWLTRRVSWLRSTISLSFLLAFFSSLYYLLLRVGFIDIINDPEEYRQFLENAGGWMSVIYILLQYLQVIVLPIPSLVSTVAGVALFGPHFALIFSFIGIVLGSLTAFFIGRKFGYKAVVWIVGEEDLKKWQTKLKGKDNLLLTAMFLLPLFPDDVLCFVSGLSSMSVKYFIIMMLICRAIGITTTCYSLQFLPFDTWWGLLSWGIIYAVVIVGFIIFYKNMDKINVWIAKIKKRK